MSQVAESISTQRMRVAAIVAGGVAVILFVQDFIGNASWLLVAYSQVEYNPGTDLGYLWQSLVFGALFLLAFAVGAGVSLWRLAPVTGELALGSALRRALLAAGAGAVLVFLLNLGLGLFWPLSSVGPLFGNSFPELPWGGIWHAASTAFQQGMMGFVHQAPVVVLVVLLVWIWLGRHPSRHADSDAAVEV